MPFIFSSTIWEDYSMWIKVAQSKGKLFGGYWLSFLFSSKNTDDLREQSFFTQCWVLSNIRVLNLIYEYIRYWFISSLTWHHYTRHGSTLSCLCPILLVVVHGGACALQECQGKPYSSWPGFWHTIKYSFPVGQMWAQGESCGSARKNKAAFLTKYTKCPWNMKSHWVTLK